MSKKKYSLSPGQLTDQFTRAVSQYLMVETELAPADIAIIFGSNFREVLAERGAALYHQKLVQKIIVSGGVRNHFKDTEAVDIAKRLESLGVPKSAIYIENKARNTGENVIYCKKLAAKEFGLENIKSIIGVGSIHASRRFMMTVNKHWPEPLMMFTAANMFPIPKEQWHSIPAFKRMVFNECKKIRAYTKCGFIAEVDINDINRRVISKRAP